MGILHYVQVVQSNMLIPPQSETFLEKTVAVTFRQISFTSSALFYNYI